MAAYLIVEIEVKDPAEYEEYRKQVPGLVAKFGGKYLVRGGDCETLEGDWQPKRVVVVEFESMERAKEWWDSMEYRPVRDIRHRSTQTRMILVQGV